MENDFFLNAAAMHFEPSSSASPSMPAWHSLSSPSAMDIQVSSEQPQQQEDCFYNPTWEKSTMDHHQQQQQHQALQFDSALSSMVSSPAASNSNLSNDNFVIRELIGKLGNMGNAGEISSYMNGTNSANTSCYSTPLSSPPKLNIPPPLMNNNNNQLMEDKLPMALNPCVAEFSADPGFAERAAKFSCFGSRSFNGRSSGQHGMNNNADFTQRSNPLMENGKLSRVSSSPSLKVLGSQMENKNSPLNSQEESTISEQNPNGESGVKPSPADMTSRKRKASSKGKSKESPPKAAEAKEDSSAKRHKPNEGEGHELKADEESKGGNNNGGDEKQSKSNNSKPPEPPKDYIHVRARRGQATDSHSLAERVRREKISERMKLLQDLVPGCNKVTGKALMLDEIINYVQSLQRQVEFLSMKLASVNTRLDVSIDNLISKDIFQSNNSLAHQAAIFSLDSSATAFYGPNPAIHDTIPNGTVPHSMESLDSALCQSLGFQLPPLNGFNEGASQYPMTFCEEDLHAIVQMGFGQTENGKTPTQSPSFNGPNQMPHMKVEL